jgi:hypothetical protein
LRVLLEACFVHPDDINMALMDSEAVEMVVVAMDLKCSQSAKVVGLEDAEISLKGSGTADADDADTGLKDSGIVDVVQVNLFSRVTPVEGLEASFELLLAA